MNTFFALLLRTKKEKRGFTLVELLVAASILITALGAPLYLGIQGVIIATEAKNKIAATFLAEEGIELIRNIRDTNVLGLLAGDASITSWKMGFAEDTSTCLFSAGVNTGCVVGRNIALMTDSTIVVNSCGSGECPNLEKVVGGGEDKFGYAVPAGSGEVDAGFKRTVRITEVPPPVGVTEVQEVKVAVTVEWFSRGTQKEITVEEHLFNYGL